MAAVFGNHHYPSTSSAGNSSQHDEGSYDHSTSIMMSHAESVVSDGHSMVSGMAGNLPSYLSSVRPPPEYISPTSASQVATDCQYSSRGSVSEDEDSSHFDRNGRVAVAEGAVALVNSFLDKLLYDFLSAARSTSLLALKPAVADVLKKSLARDAIARAEEDLEDLLALQESDDDGELLRTPKDAGNGKWNMEFIWKRTRLRVMMRSEKSEFDIEDDERYVEQEGLLQSRRFSQTNVISLSSEIFLAGVLDFIAEQLLSLGSTAASVRTRRLGVNAKASPALHGTAHILVQEPDVEKAALNSSLERLWRMWRKSLRARGISGGRRSSGSASASPILARRESAADTLPNIPDMNYPEHVIASNIPLPMTPKDIDEIEVPWLARDPDEKVPQDHVTDGRLNHRAIKSVGNFSYFRPTRSDATPGSRPSTSPQPVVTPFVNAPGAWPVEALDDDTAESRSSRGDVSVAKEEAHLRAPGSSDVPASQIRASPIPTLDPSQLDSPEIGLSDSTRVGPASGYAEAEVATMSGPYSTDLQEQAQQARLSDEYKRKSIGDMRTLITNNALQRDRDNYEYGERTASGTFLDDDDWEDERPYPRSKDSAREAQAYVKPTHKRPHILEGQVPRHMTDAHRPESSESSEYSEPSNVPKSTIDRSDLHDSPVLPSSTHKSAGELSQRSNRLPPRLPLQARNSLGPDSSKTDRLPGSPKEFLAGRNLSPSSSLSDSPREQWPKSPHLSAGQAAAGATTSETPRVTDAPPSTPRDAPRALQGLGISRQPSDEFKGARRGSPVLQQRSSEDRIRRSPKIADGEPSTPGSMKNSPRLFGVEKMANMEEANRSNTSLTKLTSASITSPEDFDLLIRGNETIKYSLTPETARDLPKSAFNPLQAKVNGRSHVSANKGSITSLVSGKKPAPIDTELVAPRPSRAGVISPTTSTLPKDKQKQVITRKSSISRPTTKNEKPTAAGTLPREPTVQTQSTRDFADFIRTTGPETEPDIVIPLLASRSTQSLRSMANSQSPLTERARSVSAVSLGKQTIEAQKIPPVPAMPSPAAATSGSSKPSLAKNPTSSPTQLTARGASGSAGVGNSSELIDFIRNGPHEAGSSRIPRNVAPFRNTMDSDELQLLGDKLDTNKPLDLGLKSYGPGPNAGVQRPPGASLQGAQQSHNRPNTGASNSVSSQPPSTRSSTNSQGRLLPNGSSGLGAPSIAQPAYSAQPSRLGVPVKSGGPPLERKRHRNKDPYYIDDSEDDDLLTALPQDRRPEESLMDFLRNNDPPPNNAPKPLAPAGEAQARAMLNRARANSINSLRSAAGTAIAPSATPGPANGKAPAISPMSPVSPLSSSALHTPANGLRSVASSIAPSTRSATSNTTMRPAHITAHISSPGSVPRNPNRARMEVRDAGDSRRTAAARESDTKDLADFFRSSGPPEPVRKPSDGAPAPVVGTSGQKIEKKKGSRFWRRKTYLDLP